jgi:hypothetical protein
LDLGVKNQVFRNVNSEGDVFGVLLLIWLRSGDRVSTVPTVSSPAMHSMPFTNQARGSKSPAAAAARPAKR